MYEILPHGKGNRFKEKSIVLFNDIYYYWLNKSVWNIEQKKQYIQTKIKSRYKDYTVPQI